MSLLACPLCLAPLVRREQAWVCPSRHSFDIAREGYVNLLPAQFRKSRAPGDNDAMVRARRDFLAAGHYRPLCDAVVEVVRALAPASLLDLGCGEGYYTAALAGVCAQVVGVDISRPAIQSAARRDARPCWVVAGGARLPLRDGVIELATSLFSPLPLEEFARVLSPGGRVLFVTPGADHLEAFRHLLFDEVHPHHPEKFLPAAEAPWCVHIVNTVTMPLSLDGNDLKNLCMMTPYAWRAQPSRRAAVEALSTLTTHASFSLVVLEKR